MFRPARPRTATALVIVFAMLATLVVTSVLTAPSAGATNTDLTAPVGAPNATTYSQAFTRTDGQVTASYTLGGSFTQAAGPTQRLPQRNSGAVTFSPTAVGGSTVAQVRYAPTAACGANVANNTVTDCGAAGTLRINFTKPVSNPTLQLVGLGEQQGNSAYGAYLRVRSAVTSDGTNAASIGAVQAGSGLARTATQVNTSATRPDPQCVTTAGALSNGSAGCGSVAVGGTNLTSVTFDVGMRTANNDGASGITAANVDTFNLALSIPDVAATGSPLSCANGAVYSVDRTTGNLFLNDPATGDQTLAGGFAAGNGGNNALAITPNGAAAYTTSQTVAANTAPRIQRYDALTGAQTTYTGPTVPVAGSIIMGGINPVTRVYHFGVNSSTGVQIFGFNIDTNTAIAGRIALISGIPAGGNGDMAFDSDGRLYIVATTGNGSATANPLFLVPGAFPATGDDARITAKLLAYLRPETSTFNSLAFSGGYLYVGGVAGGVNFISQVDPSTGTLVTTSNLTYGGTADTQLADFGSCQTPNPLRGRANIVNRVDGDDEFTVQVASTNPVASATGTTSGGRTGLRNDPAETAGPLLAVAGRTYTVTETAANPDTALADYAVTYACTRNDNGAVVTSGTGTSASFTYPTPASNEGIGVSCVFTNQASTLSATKTNPASLTAGQNATYTFGVRNSGPSPAVGATLTDRLPANVAYVSAAGTDWSCTPSGAVGTGQLVTCTFAGTIPAGATNTALAMTVRPNGTAAGTSVTNRAAVDPTGGTTPPAPTDCTATGTPDGCAVAPAQPVSDAVTAVDDTNTTPPATAVTTNVRANDSSVSGAPLANPTVTTPPANGTATVTAGGQITYTPRSGFSGVDTFGYQVCSSRTPGACATATVTVTVANTVTAGDDTFATDQNSSATTPVLANDTVSPGGSPLNPASVRVTSAPANGTATPNPDGTVTYTPTPGFTGTDSYRYQVCDSSTPTPVCASATVRATVRAGVVVAGDDSVTTTPGQAATLDVRANDSSSTGQALATPTIVTAPGKGVARVNPDGTITYTPNAGTSGGDTFTYRVCDTSNPPVCANATVRATVQNTVTANPDTADTAQNTGVRVPVLTNDTVAPSGAPLDPASVTVTAAPARGTTAVDPATGAVTYTPAAGTSGKDTFTYRVCDTSTPTPTCDTATATVTVAANTVTARTDIATTAPATAVTTDVRGNDTSSSGQPFANPTITRAPGRGSVVVNPDGTVTYTPAAGFSGVDTYRYRVCDTSTPTPVCASADVTVTVPNAVDAVDDSDTVAQNDGVVTAVLSNDTVTPGGAPLDPASVTVVTAPEHGTAVAEPDGTITYAPTRGYAGTDAYTYRVCDTSSPDPLCDTAIVALTVSANAVDAVDDTATTTPATPVTVTVLANDTSASGQALDVPTIVSRPANGTVTVGADRRITYTPRAGFSGGDSFVYRVCDTSTPTPVCDTATVALTVQNTVDAVDDAAGTPQNTAVTVAVLTNDTTAGAPLDPASVRVVRAPSNGTAAPNVDGSVTYTPNPAFSGGDAFDYEVCDTSAPNPVCDTATARITVGANTVDAVDDTATAPQNTAVDVSVLGNDTTTGAPLDPTSVTVTDGPANGTATARPDGTVTYTPAPGFSGTDTFGYSVCDTSTPNPVCDTATVTVAVGANTVDAVDDAATTAPRQPVSVDVRANDTTSTGQPLADPSVTTAPARGTTEVNADGTITYTPTPGTSGVDTFAYTVCDTSTPNPVCDTATVRISVPSGVTAADDEVAVDQNGSVTAVVLTNDTTTDGGAPLDPGSVRITGAPTNGTATANADGTVVYTPARGYTGPDTFTYRVCDTSAPDPVCDTATVTATVGPDVVVANDDAVTTQPGRPVTVWVRGNDTTSTGQPLADPTVTTQPTKGTATAVDDGTITYTPNAGTSGADSFGYQVCDTSTPVPVCSSATVRVQVQNTVYARDDSASTPQNTDVVIPVLSNDWAEPGGAPLDPASVRVLGTGPSNGTATVDPATGAVTYTPGNGTSGVDSFTYQVCDTSTPDPVCADARVTVDVGENTVSASDDTADTTPGQPVTIDVRANDSSGTGQPLAAPTVQTGPTNGTATVDGDGNFVYTPTPGTSGLDTFTYQVCDTGDPQACDTATVTVRTTNTVTAAPDTADTGQNAGVTLDVLANDSVTAGGAPLDRPSLTIIEPPVHGTATTTGDTVRYTPAAGYSGRDAFTYRVCDTSTPPTCASALATITVAPNTVTAVDDVAATNPTDTVQVAVLLNDSTASGQELDNPVVADAPANGTARPNGALIEYTPRRGFSGLDIFTYRVCDTGNPPACGTATVRVQVENQVVANPDTVATAQNTAVTVPVTANDTVSDGGAALDPGSVRISTAPSSGTATPNPDGTITVTPAANFTGELTFGYTVCDTSTPDPVCSDTSVTVAVGTNSVDAVEDSVAVAQNGSVSTDVLANDTTTGAPLDAASLQVTRSPLHGSTDVADGRVAYTPTRGYSGPDSYAYRVCDTSTPDPVCDTATVTLAVEANVVVANPDGTATAPTVPVTVDVRANDSTGSGQELGVPSIVTGPGGGDAEVNADGDVVYTPRSGFSGVDTFTYRVCDTGGPPACATATVTVEVASVVTANPDDETVAQNTATRLQPWDNDTVSAGGAPLDPQSVTVTDGPARGRVDLNEDGSLTYTPDTGYSGPDTLTYRVCDTSTPTPVCASAPIRLTVAANTVVARDDSAVAPPGEPVVIRVEGNDTSGTGQPLAAPTISVAPQHGQAVVLADRRIRYTPAAGYSGPDAFTYQVCDTSTSPVCDTATVQMQVSAAPAPTTAVDDSASTTPGNPVRVDVRANDTTGSAPLRNPTPGDAPAHGRVTVNPDGTLTYTPARGFSGTDTLTYRVCDSATPPTCDDATVTVTVPNAVTAADDVAAVDQGGSVRTPVLGNDTVSPGGSPLDPASVRVTDGPAHGTATANPDGTVTYTPDDGFSGDDAYAYEVCDTSSPAPVCDTAEVLITVRPGVVAANDDAATTTPATALTIDVRANDSTSTGRPFAAPDRVGVPAHGTALLADGNVVYTPEAGFSGADTFTYRVCDTSATPVCDTAEVRITVANAVTANPDAASTFRDTPARIDLLPNDTVSDGGAPLDPASVRTLTDPAHGGVTIADGIATYTPARGYTGPDVFRYRVCDTSTPAPVCAETTVRITVTPPDIEPVDDAATTRPGTPVAIAVLGNDRSTDNRFTTPSVVREPAKGTVRVNDDDTITYTPRPGTSGVDTFDYQVCEPDAAGDCAEATVTVTVANAVTAVDDTARTPAGTAVTTTVLANDAVLTDGAPLNPASVTVTVAPDHGTAVAGTDGTITYTPADGYTGTHTYRYRVCDTSTPEPVCAEATVTVAVVGADLPAPPPTSSPAPSPVPITPAPTGADPAPVTSAPDNDSAVVVVDQPRRRGPLAFTGAVILPAAGIGLAALLIGTLFVRLGRRRRE